MKHYTKRYETPNHKWSGFADAGEGVLQVDPKIKGALFSMYDCFDRIGDGIFCLIEVEPETGNLLLSFNGADVKFLRSYKINVEEWLDEAYDSIIGHDFFQPIFDCDPKSWWKQTHQNSENIDVLLLDVEGFPSYKTPANC